MSARSKNLWLAITLIVIGVSALALTLRASPDAPKPAPPTAAAPAAPVPPPATKPPSAAAKPPSAATTSSPSAPATAVPATEPVVDPAAIKPPGPNVSVVITVVPGRKATVYWGKRVLGVVAPRSYLVVQRPRDSGPLDLIIRSDGCLPVQTRAYTFSDTKLAVKLTPINQKNTLLGYREELPPDAGAPLTPDTVQ
jgi:hypothetical protein